MPTDSASVSFEGLEKCSSNPYVGALPFLYSMLYFGEYTMQN